MDTPLTRYPPLYPVLLAAGGPLGLDPLATARWASALLFAANILFVGLALAALLPRSRWLPLAGALLAASGLPLLTMHSMAWSEPLFLLLSFLCLFVLAAHLDQERPAALLLAGLLGGLAFLTRYAAIPFLAAGVLGLLFMGRPSASRRLASAALFAGLALLPMALWTVRNLAVADTAAARVLAWHPAGRAHLWQALYTVAGWLHVPDRAPNWLRLGLLLAVAGMALAAAVLMWRTRPARQVPAFVKLLALLIPLYSAFLAASISLLDASTPLDDRILTPLYVAIHLPGALCRRRAAAGRNPPPALAGRAGYAVAAAGRRIVDQRRGLGRRRLPPRHWLLQPGLAALAADRTGALAAAGNRDLFQRSGGCLPARRPAGAAAAQADQRDDAAAEPQLCCRDCPHGPVVRPPGRAAGVCPQPEPAHQARRRGTAPANGAVPGGADRRRRDLCRRRALSGRRTDPCPSSVSSSPPITRPTT
ncbi:MAG: glycosyltransferase family 39 protein [Anaerolineae bacterium]